MFIVYNIIIKLYFFSICIASLFNNKARLWIRGRKGIFRTLKDQIDQKHPVAWFHCASLGEFEQGRPVIEKFRDQHPDMKILLTFFSPSGYEVRKDYTGADFVFYLPLDSPKNARRFISIVNPEVVYFIKYEYWYFYLKRLNKNDIPVFLVSAGFRNDQVFFKWYGAWYRKILKFFSHLFVKNESSKELLGTIGIDNVTVSGDTRFDRVADIAGRPAPIPLAEQFKQDKIVVVAGSTWPGDEEILVKYINGSGGDIKFIIAPHEISKDNIIRLCNAINKSEILFSEAGKKNIDNAQVLIIDNVGMLSSLYKYGSIAYIGGGFGKGIHNILEAACFGMPVLFGPNYKKFNEAGDLIRKKAAFCVNNYDEFKDILDGMLSDISGLKEAGRIAREYVESNVGATDIILEKTVEYLDEV